jgi:peptidoglycan/xylan/chitin deacetylase (PgdA/CDA1 family)
LILLFWHRIAELSPDRHRLCTGPARFDAQLAMLRERFRLVPLHELVDAQAADRPIARAVALTLDDGTADAREAARIAERHGARLTFFVTSEGLDLDQPREAWWDTLERLGLDERAHAEEHARLLALEAPARAARLAELLSSLAPRESHRLLLAGELRALGRSHDVGAHGVHHLWLPRLDQPARRAEMGGCKRALEALLARPVRLFAYPYGAHDPASCALAEELGYRAAVTVEPRAVAVGDSLFRLPRLDAQPLSVPELAARLEVLLE